MRKLPPQLRAAFTANCTVNLAFGAPRISEWQLTHRSSWPHPSGSSSAFLKSRRPRCHIALPFKAIQGPKLVLGFAEGSS